MIRYYASKLSNNISKTPDGYLLCKNVPISRTGKQIYYGSELGAEYDQDRQYPVFRDESDVFDIKAMASFEGKPVCDDHPNEDVTSQNVTQYLKGTATNIRRGSGDDSDKLLADLIIYDQNLIDEIQSGKREISCGYDCITELGEDNRLYQRNIRGNHVAVVDAGRAGEEVCIKDQKPKKQLFKRKEDTMAKKSKKFWSNLFSTMKDADPEAVAEIVEEVIKQDEDTTNDNESDKNDTEQNTQDNGTSEVAEVLAAVQALTDQVQTLSDELASMKTDSEQIDEDSLSEVENALEKVVEEGASGEADNSVDPNTIDNESNLDEDQTIDEDTTADNDMVDEDIVTADEENNCDNEPTTATSDAKTVLREIRKMKPIIASMKDKKAKKAMTDSLVRLARPYTKNKGSNSYKRIADAKKNNLSARQKAIRDEATIYKNTQKLYNQVNPHMKKEGK